jgi:hypothetical protein
MKRQHLFKYVFVIGAVCILGAFSLIRANARSTEPTPNAPQAPLSTAFTYQGQLRDNGAPATGDYDFQFTLYNVETSGSPLLGTTTLTHTVPVTQGHFTVQLDFGDVFENQQLFLEIAVRPGGTAQSFTTLDPRQAITPVPYARYAIQAANATTAQSVAWTGVSDKPAELFWRSIYIPASAMNFTPGSNLSTAQNGIEWPNTIQLGGFGVPRPNDWIGDASTPFTVTLYFALYTTNDAGYVNWRLHAGTCNLNLPVDYPDSGWDQISYGAEQDAGLLGYGDVDGGRHYLMKEQSWVPMWSSTYNGWYFGSGLNTNNDFSDDPMWYFYFERGAAAENGETYTGDMYVVGAEITYMAVQ